MRIIHVSIPLAITVLTAACVEPMADDAALDPEVELAERAASADPGAPDELATLDDDVAEAASCAEALGNLDSAVRSIQTAQTYLPTTSAAWSNADKGRREAATASVVMVFRGDGSAWVTRARTYTSTALSQTQTLCNSSSRACQAELPLFIAVWKLTFTTGRECL